MTPLFAVPGLLTMLIVVVGFMLLMSLMQRPIKKQQAQQAEMRNQLAEGTRVMLTSGLFGTVTHVGQEQLIVELAPGVEVTALKSAVAKVVQADDEEFEFDDQAAGDEEVPTGTAAVTATPLAGQGMAAAEQPAEDGIAQDHPHLTRAPQPEPAGDSDAATMTNAEPGTEDHLGYPEQRSL